MSHYDDMLNQLGAFRSQDDDSDIDDLVSRAMSRLNMTKNEIGVIAVDLWNGGEFCYPYAVMAAINGWRRVGGELPKQRWDDPEWYLKNAPESTDEGAKLVIREIAIIRDEMEAERILAKQKQDRRKKLKAEGYIKVWVKPTDIQNLLRKSGGLGIEMRVDDGVMYIELQ